MTLVQTEPKAIKIWSTDIKKVMLWSTQIRPTWWTPWANTMIYYEFDWNLNDSSWNNRNWMGGWTITYWTNYADLTSWKIAVPNLTLPVWCTISFWFKCNSTSWQWMVDMINNSQNKIVYRLQMSTNKFNATSDFPSYQWWANLWPYDTSWHHSVAVFGTDNIRYYYDNTLIATHTKWSGSVTTGGNYIGAGWNGTWVNPWLYAWYFIVEDKWWTAQEISDYYNLTKWNYWL